jgi:hypothetical protein
MDVHFLLKHFRKHAYITFVGRVSPYYSTGDTFYSRGNNDFMRIPVYLISGFEMEI